MYQRIQNRTDLYKMLAPLDNPGIVPQGVHDAKLIEVRQFSNSFGQRIGLVFEIVAGPYQGATVMESAAVKANPKSKLSELLRGMGAKDCDLLAAHDMIGHECKIAIRHEQNRSGKAYAAIVQTFP